jgi:tetratricopeptide (TPR) repeat protein
MNSFEPFNRGVELSMAQRDEEALVAFDEALRADPEHLGALAGKGICLARLGRIDLALETFIAASLRDPDDPNLHLQAGLCFLQLAQVAQARGCVELAIGKVGFERSRENWAVELYNVGGSYMKGAAGWRARGSETQDRVGYQLAEACFGLASGDALSKLRLRICEGRFRSGWQGREGGAGRVCKVGPPNHD